jgi:predicted metal-dependent phosphotriesterase family hydrolase
MNEYEMAANNGEIERAQMVAEQINELEARRIQAMNEAKAMEGGRTISDMDRQQTGRTISDLDRGRTISDMDRQIGMMYGGEMKRYANGGEIEAMLGGMDSGEQEAMGELEQMAPEMEMIDQLVMMVAQMIQQGASEEQVISFLREQGLDDEDIGTVLQLVAEMAETEDASMASQNEIGADLEQLG